MDYNVVHRTALATMGLLHNPNLQCVQSEHFLTIMQESQSKVHLKSAPASWQTRTLSKKERKFFF